MKIFFERQIITESSSYNNKNNIVVVKVKDET